MGEEPKNFHDVARPGSTPQSSTSRPIIVNREPLMRDPMMKGEEQPEKSALPDHKDEPTVSPQTLTAAPANVEPTPPAPETPPESEVSTAIRSSIPPAPNKEAKTDEDKVLQEASDKVQGLIESKTYAVPVGHLERKRKVRVVIIVAVVVIVVGSASAYLVVSSM